MTNTDWDDIKTVALASVLWSSPDFYNVVHTYSVSIYLKGLANVNIGNPSKKEGDVVSYISLPDNAPFQILCKLVAKSLGLCEDREYKPYLGFARKENEVDRQLASKQNVVLFCHYMNGREVFLNDFIEQNIKEQDSKVFTAVCCGSRREDLIRGAYDFRELIQIDEVIKNRDRICAIVTSTPLVKEIGCVLDIPVVYLYSYAFVVCQNGQENVGRIEHDITQLRDALVSL